MVVVFLLIGVLIVGGIGFGIYRLTHPQRSIVAEYEEEDWGSSSEEENNDDESTDEEYDYD